MPSPIVGPSYNLTSRPASVQRTINMYPVPLEPGNERTDWVLKDVPGLRVFSESQSIQYVVYFRVANPYGTAGWAVDSTFGFNTEYTFPSYLAALTWAADRYAIALGSGTVVQSLGPVTAGPGTSSASPPDVIAFKAIPTFFSPPSSTISFIGFGAILVRVE